MGNDGPFDRPPWIDIKIARRTVQSFGTRDDQLHAQEYAESTYRKTACAAKCSCGRGLPGPLLEVPDAWHFSAVTKLYTEAACSGLADDLAVSDFNIQCDAVAILPEGVLGHAGFVFHCQLIGQ